jgi:excisionase family DNA binding protein
VLAYSVEEVGRLLGIGRTLAYAAVARGEIPSVKIGGRTIVPKVAVERMLAQAKAAVGSGPTG